MVGSDQSCWQYQEYRTNEILFLQMPFQSQFLTKLMDKEDAPKLSQVAFSKGKVQNSQSFWQSAQCSFLRKVLPELYF